MDSRLANLEKTCAAIPILEKTCAAILLMIQQNPYTSAATAPMAATAAPQAPTEIPAESNHGRSTAPSEVSTEMETEEVPPTPEMDRKPAAIQENTRAEQRRGDTSLPAGNSDAPPTQQPTTNPTPTPTKQAAASLKLPAQQPEPQEEPAQFQMGTAGPRVTIKAPPKDRRFDRLALQTRKPKPTVSPKFAELLAKHNEEHSTPLVMLAKRRSLNDNNTSENRGSPDPARRKKGESTATPVKQTILFPEKDEWSDTDKDETIETGAGATNNDDDASPAAS